MSSKYLVGKQFKSLRQLIKWCKKGKPIFFICEHLDRARNSVWVLNQQYRWLEKHYSFFYKAKPRKVGK